MTVSMERDSINWVKERGLTKESYFLDRASKPGSRHTVGQLCSGALRLGCKTRKRYPRTNLGLFAIVPSRHQTGDNKRVKSPKNHKWKDDPLQAMGLLLWLGARRHWCRCRSYYVCPALLHQPANYIPKLGYHTLALQSTILFLFSSSSSSTSSPLVLLAFFSSIRHTTISTQRVRKASSNF